MSAQVVWLVLIGGAVLVVAVVCAVRLMRPDRSPAPVQPVSKLTLAARAKESQEARVAAAEAKRRELNSAAVAKLCDELGVAYKAPGGSVAGPEPVKRGIICPHCGERGHVHTAQVRVKRGISGGKSTAALLTGGWSLLATGLARKESVTQASCGACGSRWQF